jgi:hypothetical protein
MIGKADCVLRIGVRDDQGWLAQRIERVVPFNIALPEITLWSLPESARRIGISIRVAQRALNQPAAFLDRGRKGKFPLFAEKQLDEIYRQVACGRIKVQRRSLKKPKRGVCEVEARHVLASDLATESSRIIQKRKSAEFWANLL